MELGNLVDAGIKKKLIYIPKGLYKNDLGWEKGRNLCLTF